MTQLESILAYLKSHDGITTLEASDRLRICRISERVRELESKGYSFSHTPETTQTGARVIRYRLQKAAPQGAYQPPASDAWGSKQANPAGAAPNEQMVHGEYLKDGKRLTYSYIAVGYADKPAW